MSKDKQEVRYTNIFHILPFFIYALVNAMLEGDPRDSDIEKICQNPYQRS